MQASLSSPLSSSPNVHLRDNCRSALISWRDTLLGCTEGMTILTPRPRVGSGVIVVASAALLLVAGMVVGLSVEAMASEVMAISTAVKQLSPPAFVQ